MTVSPTPVFRGVVPPVATPFTPAGEVDHDALASLVERLIADGVDGLFALGSTGETAYLTDAQRVEVARTIVRVSAGRVPVIAGAIELTAPRIIDTARALAAAGVDAIVTTAPLYTLNSEAEIADHFARIAAAIDVPLWAYDVPVRVRTKLSADLLVRLGVDGVIAGVKDSSGDEVGFRRLVAKNRASGSPLTLLTGHEVVVDAMGLAGADGVVPGLANVDARGYVALWRAVEAGDWEAARVEQERLNELFEIVFQPSGFSPDATGVGAFKAAMVARGILASGAMSPHVAPLDADAVARIRAVVAAWQPVAVDA